MRPIFGMAFALLVGSMAAPTSALATEDAGPAVASLTGSQEPGSAAAIVTPGSSIATGRFKLQLDEDGNALKFTLDAHGLVGAKAAHIHLGGAGTNGPVVAFLFSSATAVNVNGQLSKGTITAANLVGPLAGHPLAELISDLRSGDAYTNIHTVANPGGEIRGQIVAGGGEGSDFGTSLTGSQEPGSAAATVAPSSSTATGRFKLQLDEDGSALRCSLSAHGLVGAKAAHIHLGGAGTNGPVVAFLFFSATAVNVNGQLSKVTITAANLVGPLAGHPLAELISDLRSGDAYTNIHTVANPGGEIRGQIVAGGGEDSDFGASLTGSQEPGSGAATVTPGSSKATGRFQLQLDEAGSSLKFTLSAHGLVGAKAAHIHLGGAGTNGPVVAFLFSSATAVNVNGQLSKGTITAANLVGPLAGHPLAELISDLRSGDTYTNVHTVANPGGEIRGQVVLRTSQD